MALALVRWFFLFLTLNNFFAGVSQKKKTPASAPTPAISAGVTPENPYTLQITDHRACVDKIVEHDSVGNADREALCQYPSRPIVANKVLSNFNNQMVFGSHQPSEPKGGWDNINTSEPEARWRRTAGEYYLSSAQCWRDARNPGTKFIREGGGEFGKPNPKPRDGDLLPNPKQMDLWCQTRSPKEATHATINSHIFALIKLQKQTWKSITQFLRWAFLQPWPAINIRWCQCCSFFVLLSSLFWRCDRQ